MSKDRALLGLKRKDKETDLYYNRYRYYEPYSARYMSKDPIGLEGGFNNLGRSAIRWLSCSKDDSIIISSIMANYPC
jgi:hypothetical protein